MKSFSRVILAGLIVIGTALSGFAGSTTPTAPKAPVISGFTALSNQNQTVKITGTETKIEYSLNSGAWTIYPAAGVVVAPASGDNSYTFKARQTNTSGAVSPEANASFRIDKNPPAAPTVSGLAAGYFKTDKQASVTAESGASIQYSNNSGAWTAGGATLNFSQDGSYSISIKQIDAAGNASPATAAVAFVIDKTLPAVNAGADVTTDKQVTLNATVSDANIASYSWQKISGTGTITFGTPSAEDTTVSASADSTYTLRLTVTDKAGNSASDDMILKWSAPAPEIDLYQSASLANGATYDFGSVKEGESGVLIPFKIMNTGNASLTVSGITLSDTAGFSISSTAGFTLAAGSEKSFTMNFHPSVVKVYTATVKISSNDADEASYTLNIKGTGLDGTPPSVPSVTGTSPTTSKKPNWSWTSSADAVQYRYSFSSSSGWVSTTAKSFTPSSDLANGTHTLYVQAADAAGNWSANGSRAITIEAGGTADVTPPAVSFTSPSLNQAGVSKDSTVVVGFSEALDSSSIAGCLKVNGAAVTAEIVSPTEIRWTPGSQLAGGTKYTITVNGMVKDIAGNYLGTDYTFSFTTADSFKVTRHYYDKGTFNRNYTNYATAFSDNYTDANVEIHSYIVIEFSADVDQTTINSGAIAVKRMYMTDNAENNSNLVSGTFEMYKEADGSINPRKAVFKPQVIFYGNPGGSFDWNNPNWNGLKPNYKYYAAISESVTDVDGNPLAADSPDYWEFQTIDLDCGLYWFKDGSTAMKYVPGREIPSEFYDKNKPTVIYAHGWEKTSVNLQDSKLRDYRREGFNFRPGSFYPSQAAVDVVKVWKDASKNVEGKSWNFGALYWNQLADDDYAWLSKPQMAQAKIWTTAGQNKMKYAIRSYASGKWNTSNVQSAVNSPSKAVSVYFADIIQTAMADYSNSEFRLIGHSLGNQVAHGVTYCLLKKHKSGEISDYVLPKRLVVIDPYWRNGSESWWATAPKHPVAADYGYTSKTPAEVCNQILKDMAVYSNSKTICGKTGNFTAEFYDVSQTTDGSTMGQAYGDANNASRDLMAITYLVTPWINSDEAKTDYLGHKHVNGRFYYLWGYAFSKPAVGISASTTDSDLRPLMNYYRSTKVRYSITGGAATPTPGDDVYTQYTGSWQK